MNVANQAKAEQWIDQAIQTYGRLDILVNHAGGMDLNQGVGKVSDELWNRVISIDLFGPMNLSRRAIPLMVKQGSGAILNIASVAALGLAPANS